MQVLNEFATFQHGKWIAKGGYVYPSEAKLRQSVKPEEVCAFESMYCT